MSKGTESINTDEYSLRASLTGGSTLPLSRFSLQVQNYGPIHKADITVSPCTILIGPNQSGKSFLAKLIYSIYKSNHDRFASTYLPIINEIGRSTLPYKCDSLKIFLSTLQKKPGKVSIPEDIIKELQKTAFTEYLDNILPKAIQKAFGVSLKNFTNAILSYTDFNNKSISIDINDGHAHILKYPIVNLDSSQFLSITDEDNPSIIIGYKEFTSRYQFEQLSNESTLEDIESLVILSVINQTYNTLFLSTAFDGVYFPSGRTALMEMRERLTAGLFQAATIDQGALLPPLSGIHADFYSLINRILSEKSDQNNEFNSIIQEMVKGTVEIDQTIKSLHTIRVLQNGEEIPLNLLSSGVTELLPILLYIKYRMKRGDLLIIEEPEAHLHPGMQRVMAKLITKLIRFGVSVIITTHSDFLLSQLSNHVILSRKTSDERKEITGDTELFLSSNEIAVYSMEPSDAGGYLTRSVPINSEDGISAEEFLQITESLYDEIVKIHQNYPES